MKCDNCNQPATVHLTEIKNGKKIEKHLCQDCATANEGMPVKSNTPINELLTNFVMQHSPLQKDVGSPCEQCGISWAEFRQGGLFGCEHDYDLFESDLNPLLQRAHDGGTHHIGKVPTRRGSASGAVPAKKRVDIARLRKELQRAIETEDYERAAALRDQIKTAEQE